MAVPAYMHQNHENCPTAKQHIVVKLFLYFSMASTLFIGCSTAKLSINTDLPKYYNEALWLMRGDRLEVDFLLPPKFMVSNNEIRAVYHK